MHHIAMFIPIFSVSSCSWEVFCDWYKFYSSTFLCSNFLCLNKASPSYAKGFFPLIDAKNTTWVCSFWSHAGSPYRCVFAIPGQVSRVILISKWNFCHLVAWWGHCHCLTVSDHQPLFVQSLPWNIPAVSFIWLQGKCRHLSSLAHYFVSGNRKSQNTPGGRSHRTGCT